jgi:hypothetical protein
MKMSTFVIAAACVVLTACTSFSPSVAQIAKAQHVRFGEPLPKDGDYVLLFPAGTPLPVSMVIGGNLFEQEQQATLHVTLKRDVYVFGHYASFDGKHWTRGFKLIKSALKLEIPQKEGGNAGLLRLDMNQE